MKKLIAIFLCALSAFASDQITLTLTVTNTPSGGDSLTVNANTRIWTNSTAGSPQSTILIGSDAGSSATNLWKQIAAYGYSGPIVLVSFTSSNVITLRGSCGGSFASSISGTWATLSFATNTCQDSYVVRTPASSEPDQSRATNIISMHASDLSKFSSNSFTAGKKLVENLVQTTTDQTIAGDKAFSGTTQFRSSGVISNNFPTLIWDDANGASGDRVFKIYAGEDGVAITFADDAYSDTGNIMLVSKLAGVATLITFGAPITASDLLACVVTNSSIVNSTLGLTNSVTGNFAYPRANHTSLALGPNSGIDFGTNVFVKIKAGPAGAFSLDGIAGGRDGRVLHLYNATGQAMTINNDSGLEAVAANRIYTGGTTVTTGNGFVSLIYDSEDSRWVVMNYQP